MEKVVEFFEAVLDNAIILVVVGVPICLVFGGIYLGLKFFNVDFSGVTAETSTCVAAWLIAIKVWMK